jgi:hypothetical protein
MQFQLQGSNLRFQRQNAAFCDLQFILMLHYVTAHCIDEEIQIHCVGFQIRGTGNVQFRISQGVFTGFFFAHIQEFNSFHRATARSFSAYAKAPFLR